MTLPKGVYSRKQSAPCGANSFIRIHPIKKVGKHENSRITCPDSTPIHLNHIVYSYLPVHLFDLLLQLIPWVHLLHFQLLLLPC